MMLILSAMGFTLAHGLLDAGDHEHVWASIPEAVDSAFSDAEVAAFAQLALGSYRDALEAGADLAGLNERLEDNPWHAHFVRATGLLLGEDDSDVLDASLLTGLLATFDGGAFDPVEYWKTASALESSEAFQANVRSEDRFLRPTGDMSAAGGSSGSAVVGRRLLACSACWPWELHLRKCHCACSNNGRNGDGCSAFCPCSGSNSCEAGSQVCRAPGNAGDACHATRPCGGANSCEAGTHVCRSPGGVNSPCHATRPCGGGLNCQPGVSKCYNVPRQLRQPCSAGYGCGGGLSCQPGVQVCYHSPRRHGEPCVAGFPCGSGLSCQPGVHKCYNSPRRLGEPCVAGHECGDGLFCAPGKHVCEAEWNTQCKASQPCSTVSNVGHWDVIIVGAGAAGAAAAREFVDAGKITLLIERGPWDTEIPETQSGATWPGVVLSEATESFRMRDGTWGAMGQVVGGGTAVNDGLFIEEQDSFFQDAFGSFIDMARIRSVYQKFGDILSEPLADNSWAAAWKRGLKAAGLMSGDTAPASRITTPEGTFKAYSTFDSNGKRHGSADLIRTLPQNHLFKVATNTLVTKVIFNGKTAVGVQTRQNCACRGAQQPPLSWYGEKIVLAAGAFRTPQLLMLSGIGDQTELATHGIATLQHLPEVGKNFIDRNVLSVGVTLDSQYKDVMTGKFLGYSVSTKDGRVFEAVGGDGVASGFAQVQVGLVPPADRTMLAFEVSKATALASGIIDKSIMAFCLNSNTKSRGSVKLNIGLRGADKPPLAHANYLSHGSDVQNQRECYRKLMAAVDGMGVGTGRLPLDLADRSDNAEIDAWVRKYTMTSYHYFGTAAAGKVVHPHTWEVANVKNLYVIDASVIKIPTTVNPQATIMALGGYFARYHVEQGAWSGRRRLATDGEFVDGEAAGRATGPWVLIGSGVVFLAAIAFALVASTRSLGAGKAGGAERAPPSVCASQRIV